MPITLEIILENRNKWIEEALEWVETTLEESPPEKGNTNIRLVVLELLDDIFHIKNAPILMPVQEFFQRRMKKAIREIGDMRVDRGAVIWKLYNHSFVVKTAQHTLGFDIYKGLGDMVMPDEEIERLGNLLDILFISHDHGDHFTLELAERLVRNGKPIIAPEGVWSDRKIPLTRMTEGEFESSEMKVRVFPGHQSEMQNNVYLVEVDDLSVMHTGDEDNEDDFERWIDVVRRKHQVDILIVNSWLGMNSAIFNLSKFIHGVDPQIVITGHENELGHPVDSREGYMRTYGCLEREVHPYFVMTWGEKLTYVDTR